MNDFWTDSFLSGSQPVRSLAKLVTGELLVSPAPRWIHQTGVKRLLFLLDPYVVRHNLRTALFAPADLDLRAGQLVQPDLFVVPPIDGRRPIGWEECGVPILIAEVLSPSTARYDRITIRRRYQRSGVPAYWVVDLDARLVEV
jgi:Uma2 family endonuclease